jgi:dTDP-glucose 4,6-dehydratase/UDP-glucuronate decarboxylase
MHPVILEDFRNIAAALGEKCRRFTGKTILITGGGGFLGGYFLDFFGYLNEKVLEVPARIVCVDNLLRGTPARLEQLAKKPYFKLLNNDINLVELPEGIDFVLHMASIASPTYYRLHPIETMDANVGGVRKLLDWARTHSLESFLFFSTSEIYGDPDPLSVPTPEDYRGNVSCTGPRACYDESKRFGETLCVNFFRVHKVPVKIVRPFNVFGPGLGLDDRRVIPDFFRDALQGRPIVMLSDGNATRTFCYVADAVTGFLLALLSTHDGEAFNVGNDKPEISMRRLAELVNHVSENRAGVDLKMSDDSHYLTDNPQRRCPDLRKAARLLGYVPRVTIEEGLRRSCVWYRDSMHQAVR